MRGCVYCQSYREAARLSHALALCHGLAEEFDIEFFGDAEGLDMEHPPVRFRYNTLNPKMIAGDARSKEEAITGLKARRRLLHQGLEKPVDFLIIDTFPFGSKWLKIEALELIQEVKKKNPKALVIASYNGMARKLNAPKGGPVSYDAKGEKEAAILASHHFDAIFLHVDRSIVTLDDFFSAGPEIKPQIYYTGFIPICTKKGLKHKKKEILVIGDENLDGRLLSNAMLMQSGHFPDYHWSFMFAPVGSRVAVFETLMKMSRGRDIDTLPYKPDLSGLEFIPEMIAFSGSGYCVDSAHFRVPALHLDIPGVSPGRPISLRFVEKGLLHRITYKEFNPDAFKKLIVATLSTPYPSSSAAEISYDGAVNSKKILMRILASK